MIRPADAHEMLALGAQYVPQPSCAAKGYGEGVVGQPYIGRVDAAAICIQGEPNRFAGNG